jgi:hypothetical protein
LWQLFNLLYYVIFLIVLFKLLKFLQYNNGWVGRWVKEPFRGGKTDYRVCLQHQKESKQKGWFSEKQCLAVEKWKTWFQGLIITI